MHTICGGGQTDTPPLTKQQKRISQHEPVNSPHTLNRSTANLPNRL